VRWCVLEGQYIHDTRVKAFPFFFHWELLLVLTCVLEIRQLYGRTKLCIKSLSQDYIFVFVVFLASLLRCMVWKTVNRIYLSHTLTKGNFYGRDSRESFLKIDVLKLEAIFYILAYTHTYTLVLCQMNVLWLAFLYSVWLWYIVWELFVVINLMVWLKIEDLLAGIHILVSLHGFFIPLHYFVPHVAAFVSYFPFCWAVVHGLFVWPK